MKTQWQICIADDEYLARELLKEFLRPFPEFCVAWECETGQEAADVIRNDNPDLVFLDIQMPELTGLEVLEVTGRQHGVIFTTAYDQHALKAFDLHAVDYLLKPFSRERFETALNKARQQAAAQDNPPLKQLVSQHQQQAQRILLRERGQTIAIPFEELLYAEAQDDYVVLHTAARSWMKTQTLSELEQQLPATQFVRVHRSYMLNLQALESLQKLSKDSHQAVVQGGKTVPVSRSGLDKLRAAGLDRIS